MYRSDWSLLMNPKNIATETATTALSKTANVSNLPTQHAIVIHEKLGDCGDEIDQKNSILHVNQFQFEGQFQLSLKMARLGNGSFPSKIAQLSFNQVRQKEKQR